MHYRLQFPLTAEDSYPFSIYGLLYTELGRKHIRKDRIKSVLMWIAWSIIAFLFLKLSTYFYICAAIYLVVAVLHQVFTIKLIIAGTKRNCIRKHKQNIKDGITETVMEFYEDRLVDLSGPAKTEIDYSSLKSLILYKDTHLLLYTNVHTGFTIPRTAFANDDQVADFVAFLQSRGIQIETISK